MMMEALTCFFMITGTFFMLTATIGLLRLPDVYTRIHAVTKGSTLGLVGLLLASACALQSVDVTLKVILAILFHFLTNPVGAHMITRAAYHHLKVEFSDKTVAKEW